MSNTLSLALSHLRISLLALSVGVLLAAPLGLWSVRRPRVEKAALGVASVVQTIPGLALLAAMVPALAYLGHAAGLHVPSIGDLPAVLALSVYAVLPILRGVILGVGGIDPTVREAAEAVGMTPRQRLTLVELPLALPNLVGGLRTATVWTIGMATLATPVGGRSLGELIFGGLQTRRYDQVLLGCAAATGLALGLDLLLLAAEAGARSRRRVVSYAALGTLGALVLWAIVSTAASALSSRARPVRIGAKSFTEQQILGNVLSQRVAQTGAATEILPSLGSSVAFDALARGEIDVYVEYTGTVWTALMGRKDVPHDRAVLRRELEAWLLQEKGVTVAASLGFEDAYALVVRDASPARRISDLGSADNQTFATDYEFLSRPEWTALQDLYGVKFHEKKPMDPSLLYDAVASGAVDVGTGYSSDGRIEALHLRALEDDRGAIPPYDAIILVRASFAADQPRAFAALQSLEGAIDVAHMRAMNLAVDRDRRPPADVAREVGAAR